MYPNHASKLIFGTLSVIKHIIKINKLFIMQKSALLSLLLIIILCFACKKDEELIPPGDNLPPSADYQVVKEDFFMYMDYSNTQGSNPSILLDQNLTQSHVLVQPQNVSAEASGSLYVNVEAQKLQIKKDSINYRLADITVEELNAQGNWFVDSETEWNLDNNTSLHTVLVLDVSKSLTPGTFSLLKQNAIRYVRYIREIIPSARFAVVAFSSSLKIQPFAFDPVDVENFINGLTQGEFTQLYAAMDSGVDMLLTSGAADTKSVLVFTDGIDNFSNPVFTPASIKHKLISSNIKTFIIGYEGNQAIVDRDVLTNLAVNGDIAFPKNETDLERTFDEFSRSTSHVFSFLYRRSQQIIPFPKKIRVTLHAEYDLIN